MTDKPTIQMVREVMDFAESALSHERICRDCAEGGCLTADADGRHGCPDCTNDEAQARLRALSAALEGMVLVPRGEIERVRDELDDKLGNLSQHANRRANLRQLCVTWLTAAEDDHD